MHEKLKKIEALWDESFAKAAKIINDKEASPAEKALVVAEVRSVVIKGRSTSGVILSGREMELALQKLDECRMWLRNNGTKAVILRRLSEAAMWAKAGLSEQKTT